MQIFNFKSSLNRSLSSRLDTEKMQLKLIGIKQTGHSSSGSKTSSGKEKEIPAENPNSDTAINQNVDQKL